MYNVVFIYILLVLLMPVMGEAQPTSQPAIPGYTYHPPQQDKPSWQRLYLWMSATYLVVTNEGQVNIDSCMQAASRSRGISRYSILAEGIDDQQLAEHATWVDSHQPEKGIYQLSQATGKKYLQLLILLGAYYTFQPHSYHKWKDSAEYFLYRAIDQSKLLKEHAMGRQAQALLVKVYADGNDERAVSAGNALIAQCRQAGDKQTEARMLVYRSKYTPPMASTLKRKMDDAQQAATLYQNIGIPEGAIDALTDLGYLQFVVGRLQNTTENLLKALELAEKINYPYTQYNTIALSTITLFQGKFGEPLRYSYQTVRTAEATRDSIAFGYFYARMSYMYAFDRRTKEEMEWAQKSIDRFLIDRNPSIYRILSDVVITMQEQGQAREAYNLAQDITKKVGIPTTFSNRFAWNRVFADCYLSLHMTTQAEKHIRQMDTLEKAAEMVRGPMRGSEVNIAYAY
ncbi:MAG: hypothetical protein J7621_30610, partial [Niastella sp.]|nr:hypothetical protein [Niastella sp.]